MNVPVKTVASQPSWILRNKNVHLAITQRGGQMAPVTFDRKSDGGFSPYFVSPWQSEKLKIAEPVLVPLRGDFFCLPFGAPSTHRGVDHVCHGEPATRKWQLQDARKVGPVKTLTLRRKLRTIDGQVTKRLSLVKGHDVIYDQHVLEGISGSYSLGHHATLAMPDAPGTVRVSTSPIHFGMTNPVAEADPAQGRYQCVAIDERFTDLSQVPVLWPEPRMDDYSALPRNAGFTDLLGVVNKTADLAWTAAVFTDRGYLWYSLKDPAVLPLTVLWVNNQGRHVSPWNGRTNCLGLEDVCGYMALGQKASVTSNPLKTQGIATAISLSKRKATVINYIHGAVKVPRGFDRVASATFTSDGVTFTSQSGKDASGPVHHGFIRTGQLPQQDRS